MNRITRAGADAIYSGQLDLLTTPLACVLLCEDDRTSHSMTLSNQRIEAGCFTADDLIFPSITGPRITGMQIRAMYSRIVLAEIAQSFGLPITPNGGDIIVTWQKPPTGIFTLQAIPSC